MAKEKRRNIKLKFIMFFIIAGLLVVVFQTVRHNIPFGNNKDIILMESDEDEYYITGKMSYPTCISRPESIPEFIGDDYVIIDGNVPNFKKEDLNAITKDYYSSLDGKGRCGFAVAYISKEDMPTEERGEIGHIKPSGWKQAKYPEVIKESPAYLYNRCHLIAYALTGQNDNERNLITGTRHMNVSSMLSFEKRVINYLEKTENHVLYRVTPYFIGNELVARGVEMEALSIEDGGEGLCFHVFVYNYQPNIEINYKTGESWVKN